MVSLATIREKVNYGLGKGAAVLGSPATHIRPFNALAAMDPAGTMQTLMVAYDTTAALSFTAPAKPANALRYLMADATLLLPGDYLTGTQDGTFFVASIENVKPPLVVLCNRTINLSSPTADIAGQAGYGPLPYSGQGGTTRPNMIPYMVGFPASILIGTKGEANPASLPDDVRAPWVVVLLPQFGLTPIQTSDQIEDDLGRTFTISSAELTPLGWRLTAMYSES